MAQNWAMRGSACLVFLGTNRSTRPRRYHPTPPISCGLEIRANAEIFVFAILRDSSNKESLLSTRWVSVLRAGHPEDLLNQEAVMAVKMKKFWETAELVQFLGNGRARAVHS